MTTSLAELRARHASNLAAQESNKGGSKGKSDYASFIKGSNLVRFLPGADNPLDFYQTAHLHKYRDAEGNFKSYRCRKDSEEGNCPVCDLFWDLWKRHKALNLGKDENGRIRKSNFGNMATLIKAKPRFFAKAVIRQIQEDQPDESPVKFVAMSQQLFDRAMEAILDEDYQDEADPENTTILSIERGNDFDIKLTDQGEFVSFSDSKAKVKKTRAGTPAEVAEWMDAPLDLSTLTKPGTYDEAREIVQMLESSLNTVGTDSKPSEASTDSDSESEDKFNEELKA